MKHYIIVKWNVQVSDKEGMLGGIKELFEKAKALAGVETVDLIVSNSELPNRHDLMIRMSLTPEGLTAFDSSDIHRQWKSDYGKYIASKTIFDCEED